MKKKINFILFEICYRKIGTISGGEGEIDEYTGTAGASALPSKADRKLIEYMRSHPEEIPVSTIAALAEHVGVAESTVTRFVKKMGYASLNLFKVLFAKEFSQYKDRQIISRGIEHDEPAMVTGRKLLDAYYDTLDHTYAAMPESVIERCAACLQQAKKIIFVGIGNSGFMAMDAAYKFFRIGLPSESSDNSHTMIMKAAHSHRSSVPPSRARY